MITRRLMVAVLPALLAHSQALAQVRAVPPSAAAPVAVAQTALKWAELQGAPAQPARSQAFPAPECLRLQAPRLAVPRTSSRRPQTMLWVAPAEHLRIAATN